ncbi:MAG TPA: peptide deformylase [Rugosimonospora sp.]|jgi:peptide deformylase|nr:peptide deformylase [Rugosimonospora sp.]
MHLPIVHAGEPVLRKHTRALSPQEIRSKEIQKLIEHMRETMRGAPGVGLAAPQVGLSLQMAVIEDRKEYYKEVSAEQLKLRERRPVPFHVLINPRIQSAKDDQIVEFFEGCLSLPGFFALVPRSRSVRVECLDHRGNSKSIEASGWYARILQHEIDHLHGNLYIDRMHSRSFSSTENWEKFWKGKPIADVRSELGC